MKYPVSENFIDFQQAQIISSSDSIFVIVKF